MYREYQLFEGGKGKSFTFERIAYIHSYFIFRKGCVRNVIYVYISLSVSLLVRTEPSLKNLRNFWLVSGFLQTSASTTLVRVHPLQPTWNPLMLSAWYSTLRIQQPGSRTYKVKSQHSKANVTNIANILIVFL